MRSSGKEDGNISPKYSFNIHDACQYFLEIINFKIVHI